MKLTRSFHRVAWLLMIAPALIAVEAPRGQTAPAGQALVRKKVIDVWADVPEYVALITSDRRLTTYPQLVTNAPPAYPPVMLATGAKAEVRVSFAVGLDGKVEDARVLGSADGRFDAAAVAAVKQWVFKPAELNGTVVKALMEVPIVFEGRGPIGLPLQFALRPVDLIANFVTGEVTARLTIGIQGPGGRGVKAARLKLGRVEDDAGQALKPHAPQPFLGTATGSTSPNDFVHSDDIVVEADVEGATKHTQSLRNAEGTLELIYPQLDPASTLTVELSEANLGHPLQVGVLPELGVDVALFDQKSYDARVAETHDEEGGLTEYGIGAYTKFALSGMNPDVAKRLRENKEFVAQMKTMRPIPKMTNHDVALGIADPGEHLVAYEFVDADGNPLRYNRNGWCHMATDSTPAGKRFDIYRIEGGIPQGAKIVLWLATLKSRVDLPVRFPEIPVLQTRRSTTSREGAGRNEEAGQRPAAVGSPGGP